MASQAESGRRPPRRRGKKGGAGGGTKDVSSVSSGPASSAACDYRPHKVAMITLTEETPTWFQCGRNTPGRDDTLAAASSSSFAGAEPSIRRNPPDVVQRYRALGEKIYQHEVALSKQQSAAGSSAGSGRDEAWVESTMRRGTLKDRVAAMSVVVSTHPVHKLHALDMLLNMVGINIDRHSGQVTGSFQPYFRASTVPIPTFLAKIPPWRSTSMLCIASPTPVPPRPARRLSCCCTILPSVRLTATTLVAS